MIGCGEKFMEKTPNPFRVNFFCVDPMWQLSRMVCKVTKADLSERADPSYAHILGYNSVD